MKIVKGIFNVLGILIAWVLTFALVIMLLVSPIVLSALSVLDPAVITKAITSMVQRPEPQSAVPAIPGTAMSGSTSGENSSGGLLGDMDLNAMIEDMFNEMFEGVEGVEIDMEVVEKVINSGAAKELIETYTEDIANAITGTGEEMQFNAEKLVEIVEDNIDEILDIIEEVVPEADTADFDREKIKTEITAAVKENASTIVDALPKPEELKEMLVGNSPELESALKILGMKDTIEMAFIAVIVVLALLIFICRIPGFRGFRWLATILYITGIINGLIGGGIMLGGSAMMSLLPAEVAVMGNVLETVVSAFATNILIRAGIMLGVAILFTVIYSIIKKSIKKKKAAKAAAELEATLAVDMTEPVAVVTEEVAVEETVTEEVVAEETVAEETVPVEIVEEQPVTVTEE